MRISKQALRALSPEALTLWCDARLAEEAASPHETKLIVERVLDDLERIAGIPVDDEDMLSAPVDFSLIP